MKKLTAFGAALAAALSSFATTYNVASMDELTNAITNAGDGDEIVVTQGFSLTAKTYRLEKEVTLRGVTSNPADSVLNAGWNNLRIELANAKAVVRDLTIDGGNIGSADAGTVLVDEAGGLVFNCVIKNNHGIKGPTALMLKGGRATGCVIEGMTARDGCGYVKVTNGAMFDHSIVRNCKFNSGGTTTMYGGVYLVNGTVSDCLIANNKLYTKFATGVYIDGDDTLLRNCTIVGNSAADSKGNGTGTSSPGAGGIYWPQKTGARIVNCIIAGNTSSGGSSPDVLKSGDGKDSFLPEVFLNNCVLGLDIGTACQTISSVDDIKFVDAANGDYGILGLSPCKDMGTDAQGLSDKELGGFSRAMGSAVDIGAYEYNPMEVDFTVDAEKGNLDTTFTLTDASTGFSDAATYAWTVTNDEGACDPVSLEGSVVGFEPTALGAYTVKLVVTDGPFVMEKTKAASFAVQNYACDFTVEKAEGLAGSTFHFTSTVEGVSEGITYLWTFRNELTGTTETSDEANPDYTPTEVGRLTVTLEVTSALGKVSKAKDNFITVQGAICYVDPDNENPTYPYDTMAKAARDFATAYAACGVGGEIVFAEKTIEFPETLVVDKGVTVRGNGERENTTLKITSKKIPVIQVSHADAVLKNVTITGSDVGYLEKGGLKLANGLVTNVVIRGNSANGTYAGPAGVNMTGGRLTGSLITDNKGGHSAAGVIDVNASNLADLQAGKGPEIDHCQIVSNEMSTATSSCNGMITLGLAYVHDCLIAGNTCTKGDTAGVKISSYGVLANCTIADNDSGAASAGGLYWNIQSLARVVNCIVAGNKSTTGNCDWGKSSNAKDADLPKVFLNCLFDGSDIGGTNCRVGDPGFRKSTPMDYELTSSSVLARDTGVETWKGLNDKRTFTITADDIDFAGNHRIMGDTVDIGAYEYNPNQLACGILIGATEGFLGQTFALTSKVEGVSGSATYAWTFTSGDTVLASAEANPFVTPTVCGRYDAELKVTVGGKTISTSKQELFYAAPRDLYVRWDAASPKFPFASPADATFDPKAAVEAALDGATVHVSGTNTITGMISISRAITLKGETGRDADWIKQTGGERVIYLNNAQAVVRGLTLAGGYLPSQYDHGAGIRIASNGGTVEDCTIRDCKLAHYGYGVGFEIASGAANAVVRRCIIRNNNGVSGTYGGGAYLCAGRVENCLFDNNTTGNGWGSGVAVGKPDVRLVNCTLVRNHGENAGTAATIGPSAGIWFDSAAVAEPGLQVVNCLFVGNYLKTADEVGNWSAHPSADLGNLAAAFTTCAFTAGELPVADDETKAMLVADPGFTDDGTYRLTKKTALRGKGAYQSWMDGATDLYGMPRVGVQHEVEPGCCAAPTIYGFMLLVR